MIPTARSTSTHPHSHSAALTQPCPRSSALAARPSHACTLGLSLVLALSQVTWALGSQLYEISEQQCEISEELGRPAML